MYINTKELLIQMVVQKQTTNLGMDLEECEVEERYRFPSACLADVVKALTADEDRCLNLSLGERAIRISGRFHAEGFESLKLVGAIVNGMNLGVEPSHSYLITFNTRDYKGQYEGPHLPDVVRPFIY